MRKTHRIVLSVLCVCFLIMWSTGATAYLAQSGRTLYEKIELFSSILKTIQEYYVDETDPQTLMESAIEGMVSSLDPHTTFFTREEFLEWNQDFEGYSGIGIYFDVIQGKITVLSVIAGGPSDKAGLKTGDKIIAIDDQSAIGIKRDDVPLKLKGPRGTTVVVTIERKGWVKDRSYKITRDEVHIESVPYSFIVQPGTGYINIARFSATTEQEFTDALKRLDAQGMNKLIIDLRQNGGGYLDGAVQIADHFLNSGKKIVYTKGRTSNSSREYFSTSSTSHPTLPLIVMIDRTSASASEILAGALQDWDRALIIGETSFGKGLVQGQFPMRDGSALLMTTARYYTPSGRMIQRPYETKSHQEYYSEVFNEERRNELKTDQSRQHKFTLILNRKVLCGGGITPDVQFTVQNDSLSEVMRRMAYSSERYFFTYVDQYMKDNLDAQLDFSEFLKNYIPNGGNLQKFYEYLIKNKFEINDREFIKNKSDIQFFLKLTMASSIWGEEARYKVQMTRDRQLLEALTHLPESEALLKRSSAMGNR